MFSDPQKILDQFKLTTGRIVADLGSGAGFYAILAAKMVGPLGRVYAVDVLKDMLQKIKNEAVRSKLFNVEALWGNIEKLGGTRLADASVDVVLVCNSLFQIEHKDSFSIEVKRILRADGRLLVVDWKDSYGGVGPQPENVVTPETARGIFEKAGFVFDRDIKDAGAHHYGLIFRR
ncbi:MAG: hypothetical protein UX89_C0016G0014 [Parcubacteria group bacterium GW2011_GWA2_47_16]|nr:MAG: hypothetical protein UX89_C0016G0014 [Parcubacteria group bacterium GW2011_GWA2_47_16]